MQLLLAIILRIVVFALLIALSIISGYGLSGLLINYQILTPTKWAGMRFLMLVPMILFFVFYTAITWIFIF